MKPRMTMYLKLRMEVFRIILVKHNVYGDKKREFVINLIETLEKVKSGDKSTTTLVAGIVLASKYRSIFVEKDAEYSLRKLKEISGDVLVDRVTHMLHDIDRITADSVSDGLASVSELQDLLGNTEEISNLFKTWEEVFPRMAAAANQFIRDPTSARQNEFFDTYVPFLNVSRNNNAKFLHLCLDKYAAYLLQQQRELGSPEK